MWADLKDFLVFYFGLERDALHVHGAIALYLASMFLLRKPRSSRLPWLVVFGVEVTNEILDMLDQFPGRALADWPAAIQIALPEALKDVWNTMLWPTVLLIFGRYTDLLAIKRSPTQAG